MFSKIGRNYWNHEMEPCALHASAGMVPQSDVKGKFRQRRALRTIRSEPASD